MILSGTDQSLFNEIAKLTTEQRNPRSMAIDAASVTEILRIINEEDKRVPLAVEQEIPYIAEAVEAIVLSKAREIVNDKEDVSQENFPFSDITWASIANQPDVERKGRGIPAETWKEFSVDYIAVMPALTGKTEKQISNAAEILVDRFNKLKTNKDYKTIVGLLLDQLAIYLSNSPNAETYMECVTFLTDKGNKILTTEEQSLLEAL